jgi:Cupin-like domain
MLWNVPARRIPLRSGDTSFTRTFATTTSRFSAQTVQRLKTWNLEEFRQKAFAPQFPAHLPHQTETSVAAQHDWFTLDTVQNNDNPTQMFSLKKDFWSTYRDIFVPLELTTSHENGTTFQQMQAPLGVLLHWMDQATSESSQRLYLAQCQLADLPQSLKDGVPTPEIVQKAGKGDVYDANLWMGLAPTYTPLHQDPNPNLFLQLAGRKVVKLFPPNVGASIFAEVQEKLGRNGSSSFRGEEMMQGEERELLEREVWYHKYDREDEFEAILDHGEALFIPLGWWHSIKGVSKGVTTSVNWWFR